MLQQVEIKDTKIGSDIIILIEPTSSVLIQGVEDCSE